MEISFDDLTPEQRKRAEKLADKVEALKATAAENKEARRKAEDELGRLKKDKRNIKARAKRLVKQVEDLMLPFELEKIRKDWAEFDEATNHASEVDDFEEE